MSQTDTTTDARPEKPSPVPRESEEEDKVRTEADQAKDTERAARGPKLVKRIARPRVLLPLLVICALCGGVAVLGIQAVKDSAQHEARAAALQAAREYAVALTSYDHKTLVDDFDKVSSNATGQFAKEYKQVSANLTQLIKKHKAVSKGTVVAAGLVSGDTDRAVVLLFVDQTITNTNIEKPRVDRNRMRMTLRHDNGRWLIDDVKLL